jgi:cytochrome c-type biogenesis protein CcmF
MIVHLGVIMIAVALVASNAYTKSADLTVRAGESVEWEGHTFELVDVVSEETARTNVVRANVLLDGTDVYGPAVTTFLRMGSTIGTPSVRTGLTSDVYLTIAGNRPPEAGASEVHLEVFLKPFIVWLWIGGLLMALGTVLAAFPGGRRRLPVDPVSAPVPERQPEPEAVVG